jgi:hypothetical protein
LFLEKSFGAEFQRAQSRIDRFEQIQIIPLLDKQATKTIILRALARLSGRDLAPLLPGDPLERIKPAESEDAVILYRKRG